jgi:hypothetical protein
MPDYTARKKLKITAGAVASLVIVGWTVVLAIRILSRRDATKKTAPKTAPKTAGWYPFAVGRLALISTFAIAV